MKKISVLGPVSPLKGISQYVNGFVEALGHHTDVEVFSFDQMYPKKLYPGGEYKEKNKQPPQYSNVTITYTIDRWNPFTWIKNAFQIQGDVLHLQYWIWFLVPVYLTFALVARYIKKIPVVITVHNVKPHEQAIRKIRLDKILYRFCDIFIVHSQDNKKQLIEIIGNKKTVHVLPHGIIIPTVQAISQEQAINKLSLPTDCRILLFFGHIRPYKGLDILLESISQLKQRDDKYHLIITGQCRENWDLYQTMIDELQIGNNITRIEGFVDDETTRDVFCASDWLVLPYTHFDAQSGVIALGLGYEIPMIVSELGGLTEVIDDERFIFETGNATELAKKISGEVDKSYIIEKKKQFGWEGIIKKYIGILSSGIKK